MNTTIKNRLVAILALSAAWISAEALAAPQAVPPQVQVAAELDGNAFLDTGNDSPAATSVAAASVPATSNASGWMPNKAVAHVTTPAAKPAQVEKRKPEAVAALVAQKAEAAGRSKPTLPASDALKAQTPAQVVVSINTTQPHIPVTPKPTVDEAVVNPMTGEELSTEDLRTNLTTATLRAEIAQQNYKAAQAQSQMSELRFTGLVPAGGPLPPKAITLADVPKPESEAKTKKHEPKLKAAAPAAASAVPAMLAHSPVTGIMTQENVRYALLQLDGKGEMARTGDMVDGRRVDAVRENGVTLDGHFYPIAAPITEIASVDQQALTGSAAGGAGHAPVVYGTQGTSSVGTPNPFAHNANGGLPPLPDILASQRGQ